MMAWIKRSHFHEFSKKNWIRVDLSSEFDPFSITFKIESLSKIIHGISETIIQPVPGFRLMRRPLVEFTRIFKGMGGGRGSFWPVYPSEDVMDHRSEGRFNRYFSQDFEMAGVVPIYVSYTDP